MSKPCYSRIGLRLKLSSCRYTEGAIFFLCAKQQKKVWCYILLHNFITMVQKLHLKFSIFSKRVFQNNFPEFRSQRPVTGSFGVFIDLRLHKRLSKQSRRRWFETQSRSLWRHCNNFPLPHYRNHGPPTRDVILRVVQTSGMPPRVSDPDIHHGTCVTHMPWCMLGSLTSDFLWSRWRKKRSRYSRRMRNPQFLYLVKDPYNRGLVCEVRYQ